MIRFSHLFCHSRKHLLKMRCFHKCSTCHLCQKDFFFLNTVFIIMFRDLYTLMWDKYVCPLIMFSNLYHSLTEFQCIFSERTNKNIIIINHRQTHRHIHADENNTCPKTKFLGQVIISYKDHSGHGTLKCKVGWE